ncbi:MAG: indolepyruvate ferredoxin oxidoreductase subunit alpha [Thermodesulfobacteriota bacterium]
MLELMTDEPGRTMLLLGNEAIARGALEAGLAFASSYPGTPSSEVPDAFFQIFQEAGFHFEYAVNEKVALEAVAGAAVAGVRAMTTFKHVGLNVAADPLLTLAYLGVKGGMVIYNADDPSMFSSQNEQDNRYYARLADLPMLEPTDAQEMKDLTVYAFDLSEKLKLPVILRSTTRLAHTRGPVRLGPIRKPVLRGEFVKAPFDLVPLPAVARRLHQVLLDKEAQAREISNQSPYNQVIGQGPWGVIANGVAFNYVLDAVNDLGIQDQTSLLKLGWTHPLPDRLILSFLEGKEKVLIAEELEPVIEKEVKALAQDHGLTLPIKGKHPNLFSRLYEYQPALVRKTLARFFEVPYRGPEPVDTSAVPALPNRPPNLCPGCPHRMTYYALKKAVDPEAVFPNDIGCYTLGILPPLFMADFQIGMGSSASSSCGFAQVLDRKIVAFIGDSTFFHSGLTGLVNGLHNNHNFTLVIMDNGTTAMTGHQPHPGLDTALAGLPQTQVDIVSAVKGLGVKHVTVVKPRNLKKTQEEAAKALAFPGLSVIDSQEICPLYGRRFQKTKPPVFTVDRNKCRGHRVCINEFACPAFYLDGERAAIDENLCLGCAVCVQVCPERAIVPRKK